MVRVPASNLLVVISTCCILSGMCGLLASHSSSAVICACRYTNPVTLAFAGGVLPFGSIFIEMYFIFTSLWHYKFYYVYGFMLLVFLILIIVTMCVTVVSTYVLLNAEVRLVCTVLLLLFTCG